MSQVEETDIVALERTPGGFQLTTRSGEIVHSKCVVIAVGITHFAYVPSEVAEMPKEFVTQRDAELPGLAPAPRRLIWPNFSAKRARTCILSAAVLPSLFTSPATNRARSPSVC